MAETSPSRAGNGKVEGRYALVGDRVLGSAVAAITGQEETIGEAVVSCVLAGDAIFFGQTRDGSALTVRVYSETGNAEWYVGSDVALDNVLRGVKEAAMDRGSA